MCFDLYEYSDLSKKLHNNLVRKKIKRVYFLLTVLNRTNIPICQYLQFQIAIITTILLNRRFKIENIMK